MTTLFEQSDKATTIGQKALTLISVLPVNFGSNGVTVHIDTINEDYYLDATVDHCPVTLAAHLTFTEALGFEVMGEDECPSTIDADGTVRTYLAEVHPT